MKLFLDPVDPFRASVELCYQHLGVLKMYLQVVVIFLMQPQRTVLLRSVLGVYMK